ncbi:MAG: phosphodiester glycosidase family protein, partial [Paludibacteraceae bacterium]|nr:phosphodiester glycosidase family protein [Paludibacteraceae bacterium]
MKRFTLLSLAFVFCRMAAAITLNGVNYTIDTLAQYPVGPGARFYELRMLRADNGSGRLDCWLMTVDTKNPYVSIEQVLGKDQLVGTERPSAMAARKTTPTHIVYGGVNGDFFVTSGDVGRPTGLTVVNNEFTYTPSNNRRLGGVDEQLRAVIGTKMTYSGKLVLPDSSYTIKHVNYTRAADELVLYNQHNGSTTGTNMYGTELLIELLPDYHWSTTATLKARIAAKEENVGSMVIPKSKAVLSGHGKMHALLNTFSVGDTVTLKFSLKVDGEKVKMSQCIGGDTYALIVNNGQVEQSDFWNELHPRTAFGCTQGKDTLLFLVVDGRGISAGCTTKVLGEIINYYGAYTAVNWDGGGSSGMYIRPFGAVNNGSDGSERAVGNAMFAVANIPVEDNTIASIAPYQPICPVPRYGIVEPKFLGYNQYGVLIDTCVQGVKLQCDASLGEILPDGRFLASGTESGTLTAVLYGAGGEVVCPITVRLMTSAPVAFRLDSLLTDNFHPYQVQIQSLVNGKVMDLLPSALTWQSSDETVATVDDDGIVQGIADGYTDIIGKVGTFVD